MQHTFLILINNAPDMGKYHLALGNELKKDGHTVVYAIADYHSIYTEEMKIHGEITYIFSDFFRENYAIKKTLPDKYKSLNINKLFFSDYDREFVHYKMKPFKSDYYENLMTCLILFFEQIYNTHKFDFCLYESVSNSFAHTAFMVSQINNAIYCGYAGSRLKGRFELYNEEYGSLETFKHEFNNLELKNLSDEELNEVNNYLKQYETDSNVPSYHPRNTPLDWNYSTIKRYCNIKKIKLIINKAKYIYKQRSNIKYSYQIKNPIKRPFLSFVRQLSKPLKVKIIRKYFDKINEQDNYVLYPLHFKPEASTSVCARHYCDDIAVIKNIAFNLPFMTKLYVKEHFVNYGRLPVRFYKEIKKIPNVKLIACEENIKNLIQKSQCVITLTSTVGFEALLMNKPVIVLGEVFYQCHPNCYKIKDYEDIFNLLKKTASVNTNKQINQKFIAAYKKITFEGNINYQLFEQNDFVTKYKAALYERYHIS
jgi:hypothetical protein